jgi:membrane-bound metal-dependent hydrolase YbcI (DUF457 family)
MDPVTHVLAAVTAAEILAPSGIEPWAVTAAAGAGLAPDADFIARRFGHTALLRWHHTVTHSVVGTGLLAAAWAAVVSLVSGVPWYTLALFAGLGALTHLGLDYILHNNGLMLAWPFSRAMFRGALFIGLNPQTSSARCGEHKLTVCLKCQAHSLLFNRVFFILAVTAAAAAAAFPWRRYVFAVGLAAVLLLILSRVVAKTRATRLAREALGANVDVFPSDFTGGRWLAAAPEDEGFRTALVDLKRRETSPPADHRPAPAAAVAATASRPAVRTFLANAILPFTETSPDGSELWWRDLSYAFTPSVLLHVLRMKMDGDAVTSEEFRERW